MQDEKISKVKNLPKSKFLRDIHVYLYFANFYQCFIQSFNKIATLLTLMFKTINFNG